MQKRKRNDISIFLPFLFKKQHFPATYIVEIIMHKKRRLVYGKNTESIKDYVIYRYFYPYNDAHILLLVTDDMKERGRKRTILEKLCFSVFQSEALSFLEFIPSFASKMRFLSPERRKPCILHTILMI